MPYYLLLLLPLRHAITLLMLIFFYAMPLSPHQYATTPSAAFSCATDDYFIFDMIGYAFHDVFAMLPCRFSLLLRFSMP